MKRKEERDLSNAPSIIGYSRVVGISREQRAKNPMRSPILEMIPEKAPHLARAPGQNAVMKYRVLFPIDCHALPSVTR